MDARDVLHIVSRAGSEGWVWFSYHAAEESLPKRGLTRHDVEHALAHADACFAEDDDASKWKLLGPLLNGESIAVVVRLLLPDAVLVITAHEPP